MVNRKERIAEAGEMLEARSRNGAEEMSNVWQNLPDEIQLKVVEEHLSLPSLCRLRCVSKSWSRARLRPRALAGLHIHRSYNPDACFFSLRSGKKRRLRVLSCVTRGLAADTTILAFINGLLACAVIPSILYDGDENLPVKFQLCNPLGCRSWTEIQPPPEPFKTCLFVGMSMVKRSSRSGSEAIIATDEKLSDGYILVSAMADYDEALDRHTNLLFQVYKDGAWNCSLFKFPEGYSLMYNMAGREKCGVLRGSVFYFLLMRLDLCSASLACIDLLSSDKRCKFLCELDHSFLTEWEVVDIDHPKLAVCSGKILLAHRRDTSDGQGTTVIQMFDEEKVGWRFVSVLPDELRGDANCCPHGISDGGDELIVLDNTFYNSFKYNLVTGAWSRCCASYAPCTTAHVFPLTIV